MKFKQGDIIRYKAHKGFHLLKIVQVLQDYYKWSLYSSDIKGYSRKPETLTYTTPITGVDTAYELYLTIDYNAIWDKVVNTNE